MLSSRPTPLQGRELQERTWIFFLNYDGEFKIFLLLCKSLQWKISRNSYFVCFNEFQVHHKSKIFAQLEIMIWVKINFEDKIAQNEHVLFKKRLISSNIKITHFECCTLRMSQTLCNHFFSWMVNYFGYCSSLLPYSSIVILHQSRQKVLEIVFSFFKSWFCLPKILFAYQIYNYHASNCIKVNSFI